MTWQHIAITPPPPPRLNELGGWIRGITLALVVTLTLMTPVAVVAQAAADADRDAPYPREVVPTFVDSEGRDRSTVPAALPFLAESFATLGFNVEWDPSSHQGRTSLEQQTMVLTSSTCALGPAVPLECVDEWAFVFRDAGFCVAGLTVAGKAVKAFKAAKAIKKAKKKKNGNDNGGAQNSGLLGALAGFLFGECMDLWSSIMDLDSCLAGEVVAYLPPATSRHFGLIGWGAVA